MIRITIERFENQRFYDPKSNDVADVPINEVLLKQEWDGDAEFCVDVRLSKGQSVRVNSADHK